jgi:hypothetical protein
MSESLMGHDLTTLRQIATRMQSDSKEVFARFQQISEQLAALEWPAEQKNQFINALNSSRNQLHKTLEDIAVTQVNTLLTAGTRIEDIFTRSMALLEAEADILHQLEAELELEFVMILPDGKHFQEAFYIQTTPVTQGQWRVLMGNNPSFFHGNDYLPVESVTWKDCQTFITRLNEKNLGVFRLPTEQEWEYCARAGSTTAYFFGDAEEDLSTYAWYSMNSVGQTHPVAQKEANPWGLYDIYGNVSEWCQDQAAWHCFFRGGGWNSRASNCRSTSRFTENPSEKHNHLGFRLVRETAKNPQTETP